MQIESFDDGMNLQCSSDQSTELAVDTKLSVKRKYTHINTYDQWVTCSRQN